MKTQYFKNYWRDHRFSVKTGFFLMGLIVAIFAVIVFLTTLSFVDLLEKKGSSGLGRNFSIEGPLDIDWRWGRPRIHVEKIKLANTPGAKDPTMLEIGKLDFTIKIWKLLIGRAEFPEIVIEDAKLILEKTENNQKNWNFPLFSEGEAVVDASLPDDRHDFPIIGSLSLKKVNIIYHDEVKGLNLDLHLDTARGSGGKKKEKTFVKGQGTLQGQAFEVNAESGSLYTLRDTGKDFPFKLQLKMGPTNLELDGTFTDPIQLKGGNASLKVNGNNMADLFYLTGIPLPPTPPYRLSGRLGKTGNIWSYQEFSGKVGDSDIAGNMTYNVGGQRGFLTMNLTSRKTDLDDLSGFIGLAPSTDPGETAAPEQKRQAAKEEASPWLLPDVPIDLKRLRSADMEVNYKADKLYAPGLPFKGMNVKLKLNQGLLKIDPMHFSLADGGVDGQLTLDGRENNPLVSTDFNLKKLKLSRFFAGTRFEEESRADIGGHVELRGRGLSLANIMADSDGRIVTIVSGGKISLLLMEASDIDIAEAVPLLFGDDKATEIRCGVGDFKVTDGILYSKIFVLDTNDTNLQGRVDINLKNETIDAMLDAQPKDPSILSLQSPITITGRLKDPVIGLTPETGLRAAGAAALGAVLTPLASIIPFIETGLGEDSNCSALVARAKKDAQ